MSDLPQDVPIPGTVGTRLLPDGTVVALTLLLFGDVQLSVARPKHGGAPNLDSWDQAYHFDAAHGAQGVVMFLTYDPTGPEPHGWTRHIPSERRRPGGDPAAEYVPVP